jgi:hypothetical protein
MWASGAPAGPPSTRARPETSDTVKPGTRGTKRSFQPEAGGSGMSKMSRK